MRKIFILIILSLFFISPCFANEKQNYFVKNIYPHYSNEEKAQFWSGVAQEYAKQCPLILDSYTTLIGVHQYSTSQSGLVYVFSVNAKKENIDKNKFKNFFEEKKRKLKNNLCTSPDMKFFRKFKGVTLRYRYFDKDNIHLKDVDIKTGSCSK